MVERGKVGPLAKIGGRDQMAHRLLCPGAEPDSDTSLESYFTKHVLHINQTQTTYL